MMMEVRYNVVYVFLSVMVAIVASFVALDLANSVTHAKGKAQTVWLSFGALAMGFGIWSMHFVGMLAFEMPGMAMAYDIPLMILSILIAIGASAIALFIVSRTIVPVASVVAGGTAMAAAIAGMHYTGMYSMRMEAVIKWNIYLVTLSIIIALIASFAALLIAIRLRHVSHYWKQIFASVLMGVAISGMHYTGMAAATFIHSPGKAVLERPNLLLATSGLTLVVLGAAALILGLALLSSVIDRAFTRRTKKAEESDRLYLGAEKAILDLRQERELRDRFVSALAHDLRNPLTAAKISAQRTLRSTTSVEDKDKHSLKVVENIERADQMIQDLLDAHRISAGQSLPLQVEACDVKQFLSTILEDLATVYGDRFILRCPEGLQGRWDIKYLRRAVENLCTNAVKYGQEGTPIQVKAGESGGMVSLSVHNEGIPLGQEEQQSLFRLFHRGNIAQTAGKRGWGLGLTIVKGIAEAHGGTVKVNSCAGEGTIFTIEIPAAL